MSSSSKDGGYSKMPNLAPEQMQSLIQMLTQGGQNTQQAAQGFSQFLPGGGGGQPIIDAAMNRYKQQTIPSIMNAFGTGSKGSTSLNQALASSASDLNTNLGSQLAGMQLDASKGLGGLGQSQQQTGLGTDTFSYLQNQPSFLQQLLLAGTGAAGSVLGGWLGGRK